MELSTLLEEEETPFTEHKFRELHNFRPTEKKKPLEIIRQSISCDKTSILDFFPIMKWLPRYNLKENFIFDIIAGLTVSVLQIPHGLAFAPLAYQQPVVGLYMAIFPITMYVVFGTSRHLSLGMMGILIIMVGGIVTSHADMSYLESAANGTVESVYGPLEVAITITFTIGLWQVVLGALHLGSLCVLLSNSLVSGLTSAASIHIVVIQLKNIFGLSFTMATGPLKVFYIVIDVVKHIGESNYVSALTALSVFVVLMLFNELIKPLVAKKTRLPIPMEFIMIAVSIVVSEFLQLEQQYNVRTVGTVPGGFPEIVLPAFPLIPKIVFDSLVIALVSISFNISLGKVFAKKGGYELDDNQELVAYGFSNVVGAFFQCLPVSASLSRSMVQFSVGGKTQLAHLISLLSVLLMLLFLGPLFAKVPLCVLAAIVMATLKGLLVQIADVPAIWRSSKLDGVVWLVTFLTVILVDIDYGIGFGLAASIFSLLVTVCSTDVLVINQMPYLNRLITSNRLHMGATHKKWTVLKIIGNINFFNCSKVSTKLLNESADFLEMADQEAFIVVDLSAVPSIDPSAVAELVNVVKALQMKNATLIIACCSPVVYDVMLNCSFFDKYPKSSVMVNVLAAMEFLNIVTK